MPFKTAQATGASGGVSITIPARTDPTTQSIRVYGIICGTLETGTITTVPNVTITNVPDAIAQTNFTALLSPPQGGTVVNQPRAMWWLPGYEFGIPIRGGFSTLITYTSGIAVGAPTIIVFYDYDT